MGTWYELATEIASADYRRVLYIIPPRERGLVMAVTDHLDPWDEPHTVKKIETTDADRKPNAKDVTVATAIRMRTTDDSKHVITEDAAIQLVADYRERIVRETLKEVKADLTGFADKVIEREIQRRINNLLVALGASDAQRREGARE